MNDEFFALKLMLKYGMAGSIIVAICCALAIGYLLFGGLGAWTVIPAVMSGGLAFLLTKSYTEMARIVFQMVN